MSDLKLNNRQHRFCLNILAGMPPQEAYAKAGYDCSPESLKVRPYAIVFDNPGVKAFLDAKRKLKEVVVLASDTNNTIASPQERKQILTELLRAQLVDFQDGQGEPALTKDTPNARAAKEYYHRRKFDKDGNPITTKSIKLTDPIAAIQELNKMDGSYAPVRHQVAKRVEFDISFRARQTIIADDSDIIEGSSTDGDG